MKLVLHIGSRYNDGILLQNWIGRNELGLRSEGVWYCKTTMPNKNTSLARLVAKTAALDKSDDGAQEQSHLYNLMKPKLETELAEARSDGMRIALISSPEPGLELGADMLKILFSPLFDDIEIVYSLRPQADELTEAILAAPLNAPTLFLPRVADLGQEVSAYNYNKNLAAWAGAFGKDAIRLLVCSQQDIVKVFYDKLGLLREDYHPVAQSHKRLDFRAHAQFERTLPEPVAGAFPDFETNKPNLFLEDAPCEKELTFSRAIVEDCQALYQAENEALCAAWDGINIDDLTPDFENYPETGTVEQFSDCDIAMFTKIFVNRMNAEINFKTARELLLQAEILIFKDKIGQARQRLRRSREHLDNATRFWDDRTRIERMDMQINTQWRKTK